MYAAAATVSGFGRPAAIVKSTTTAFQSLTASGAAVPMPSHRKATTIAPHRVILDLRVEKVLLISHLLRADVDGLSSVSPDVVPSRIDSACSRHAMTLVGTFN